MYRMRKKKSLTERMFALQVSRASEYRVNAHPYHVDFSGSCSTWVPRGCSQPPLAVGCRSVPALLCTPLGHAGAAPGQGAQQEISVPLTQLRTTTHLDQVGAVTAWLCSLFRKQSWRSPAWHLPPLQAPCHTQQHRCLSTSCCTGLKTPTQAHLGGSQPRKQVKTELKVINNILNFTIEGNFMDFWT